MSAPVQERVECDLVEPFDEWMLRARPILHGSITLVLNSLVDRGVSAGGSAGRTLGSSRRAVVAAACAEATNNTSCPRGEGGGGGLAACRVAAVSSGQAAARTTRIGPWQP